MFINHSKMTFDLKINFKGIEIKSGSINLISFLKINSRTANLINPICNFNVHVNFAETIIEGLQIIGEIDTVFNHKHFTIALMDFKKNMKKIGSVILPTKIKLMYLPLMLQNFLLKK